MATHRVDLLNATLKLGDDGNAYMVPFSVVNSGTATTWDQIIISQISTADSTIEGSVTIPANYVGTPVFEIIWTSDTVTGTIIWSLTHRVVDGSDVALMDISTLPTDITETDLTIATTVPNASSERMVSTISMTTTDFAVDETLQWRLTRDTVTDTRADNAIIIGLNLKYSDA